MIHKILEKRFNKTNKLIFLATSYNNIPYIRAMTPYYKDYCFYFISDQSSDKIKQILDNNYVAICGEWFNAHGYAYNEGMLKKHPLFNELIDVCEGWIRLGNIDVNNENIIVLKVKLDSGYVIENNKKYMV